MLLISFVTESLVHTTLERLKNAALFLRLGLPVDTNPSRKWSFPEKLFKPEEFENAGLAF